MNKTLQEIKDEYARELGYRNFEDVTGQRSVFVVESVMDEAARRYAIEVAKETQRRCADNVDPEDCFAYPSDYDCFESIEQSILSETNIPELI